MGFDKTKAMRNAERYLAQGKIRSAISEYKQVVDNDPKDFGTMNLLGDLYNKASEPNSAVTYYTLVAEHYSKQGFSQKAIAVYNKISKIQPNSLDISEKLAELYKTKGSVKEAKSHYVVLAENYQAKGRTTEALAMWKQIAILDPNNTDVYPTIADLHLSQGEDAEAGEAFAEAGNRFAACGRFTDAMGAFERALAIDLNNPKAQYGLIDAAADAGKVNEVVDKFKAFYEENRSEAGLLAALVSAHLKADDIDEAERTVVRLVEQDPASYASLIEVAQHYLAKKDFDGASRMLSMASEHMLAGGQAEKFAGVVNAVLENRPDQLEALRLFVRYCTWQRDEAGLKESLQRLAAVARKEDSTDDERSALSQLVLLMPHEVSYAERLREINALHGFEDDVAVGGGLFDERFYKSNADVAEASSSPAPPSGVDFAIVGAVIESSNGGMISVDQQGEAPIRAEAVDTEDDSPEEAIEREAESIRFYIDSGYLELAQKAIADLRSEFGEVPQIGELTSYLNSHETAQVTPQEEPAVAVPHIERSSEDSGSAVAEEPGTQYDPGMFDLGELRSELGLEEPEPIDDADYETKYQTAVAYQEMGLYEQAIAEFQEAAALVQPNDGTRRFFNCANLLGLCFMHSGMPKLAVKWYERALEITSLNSDERMALWYELGLAFEAEGDLEEAEKHFEQVYAEDVDYRDIRNRVKNLMISH